MSICLTHRLRAEAVEQEADEDRAACDQQDQQERPEERDDGGSKQH